MELTVELIAFYNGFMLFGYHKLIKQQYNRRNESYVIK